MNAIFIEQGNGFPDVGDYVSGPDQLYMITGQFGCIQTDDPRGNYCHCEVEEVDWDECQDYDEHPGLIEVTND